MTTFRIHFASGEKRVVVAETPAEAAARVKGGGAIVKIKRVKDEAHG